MLHQGCTRLVIVFSDGIFHGTLQPNSSAFKSKFDSRCLTKSPCFRHNKNELHLISAFHSQNLKKMFQREQKGLSPMYVYVFIRETYRKPRITFYIHLVDCRYCGIRQGRRTYFVSFAFSSPSRTASEITPWEMLWSIPQCNCSLEFRKILSQNLICYQSSLVTRPLFVTRLVICMYQQMLTIAGGKIQKKIAQRRGY